LRKERHLTRSNDDTNMVYYFPGVGFEIESRKINWGQKRNLIRQTLAKEFQEDNGIIDNSEFFDGDASYNIHYRRDIYGNFKTIFDEDDFLTEVEIHKDFRISVSGITLTFGKDISELINQLRKIDGQITELEEGQFFFKELKMTIGNSESMGGTGNGLDYFYATRDVTHLDDKR